MPSCGNLVILRRILGDIGCSGMDWIRLAQYRDHWRSPVKTVMNLRVPSNSGSFLSRCTTRGLSSWAPFYVVTSN
jgi:hypothetical protein